jgi:hypothetical protein
MFRMMSTREREDEICFFIKNVSSHNFKKNSLLINLLFTFFNLKVGARAETLYKCQKVKLKPARMFRY